MARMKVCATCVLLLVAGNLFATEVGPGDVSGTWTLEGSPYIVQGHLNVPSGNGLNIEPGVEVRFNGPYVLKVVGTLMAIGTVTDSIIFTTHDGVPDWGHIELVSDSWLSHQFIYCRFEHGNASQLASPYITDGGGIYASANSNLLVTGCAIEDCRGGNGGGLYFSDSGYVSHSVIRRCMADGENGEGGGVYAMNYAQIRSCDIAENTALFKGGGISAETIFDSIEMNHVHHNHVVAGHGGGIALDDLRGSCRFNLIWANTIGEAWYSDGGGIYLWYAEGTIHNNTIVGNSAPVGAGLAYGHSSTQANRNIIAFNEGDATAELYPSFVNFEHNCSHGNSGSDLLLGDDTGTVNDNPLFCDYGAGVFSLCADSPCLPEGIGAEGEGCDGCWTAVENVSWSRIKALY